ncbi:MAG: LutB/LldF family L-lactate oxidation iron-sulfur protein [Balneolaceae bacterium]
MKKHLPTFEETAKTHLENSQLRRNLGHATKTIREKRKGVVNEMPDWEELREAGRQIKEKVMRNLDKYLLQLEESVQKAGGVVHWAKDAEDANRIITGLVKQKGETEVVKVKSITTDEIGLNQALADENIMALETDLAELIVQMAGDEPSHILVPAIHKNRTEIMELFREKLGIHDLSDNPEELADAARLYLRKKFLSAKIGISGGNFAVAETGTVAVVESEGNGRMCTTLPDTLISVLGIEKIIPSWQDLEVFMQLLPRSSTAERMNPYNTFWTGVAEGDGPQEFHLVLLDNGRTNVLADEMGRQTLHCIRCSACLNVCPVYERTGGHAYHSVYPGPIGAILTPQLRGLEDDSAASLPYASSLCGACYEVCPVKINIPEVLVHLRGKIVEHKKNHGGLRAKTNPEHIAMKIMARTFRSRSRYERAQKMARSGQKLFVRDGTISKLPGQLSGWTAMRDLKPIPKQSFRDWWRERS